MTRSISATEAKNRLGAYLRCVADKGEDIVIENHGKPQAVLVPFNAYDKLVVERERARRLDAVRRLEELANRVRDRNRDLSEEQANELAQEIRDLALTSLIERHGIRFVDEAGS